MGMFRFRNNLVHGTTSITTTTTNTTTKTNTSQLPNAIIVTSQSHMTRPSRVLLLLLPHLVLLLLSTSPCGAVTDSAIFYRLENMDNYIFRVPPDSLSDTLVATMNNMASKTDCAVECLAEERCSTFFYDSGGQQCLLYTVRFLAPDEAESCAGATYWQLSQDNCPFLEGFVPYRPLGMCYKYYSQKETWDVAEGICSAAGLSLIKVDSVEKFNHLYRYLRSSPSTRTQHVSIGASSKTGTYRWIDGSEITWLNWASGEPSSAAEKCINMAWFFYFKWNDVPCTSNSDGAKYHFLCQKD